MKELEGKLTISRPHNSRDERDVIKIMLEDRVSGSQFLEITVSLEEMMAALTGHGYRPCHFTLHQSAPIGLQREYKTELVPRPEFSQWEEQDKIAAPLLAPYETDGWRGRAGDLFNSNRWRRGPNNEKLVEVGFTRHVAPNEAPQ